MTDSRGIEEHSSSDIETYTSSPWPDLYEKPTHRDDDPEGLTQIETTHTTIIPPASLWKEIVFVVVVCLAQFMTQAGLCMSIAPVYIIGESFGTSSAGELSWFTAAYSLTVGTFILICGRLGDVFGHRLMFIIGFAWFGLWSLLAGFSVWSNPIFFDCCRAFQGVGPAMVLPNAIAILGRTYPPGLRKEMIFSFFGATAPSGFIVGGVFSSIFAQLVWWPWGYWVMGMVCFILSGLGLLVIPYTPRPSFKEYMPIWVRLDLLGASAGIAALILINFAWNQAALVGWPKPYTYVLLFVGLLFLGAFGWIERGARSPLLPREALTGDLAWVLGCIAAGWSSFGIIIYYFYQFMLDVKGDSPLLATAKWSGASPSGAIAALVTGLLLSRVPPSVIMFCAMAFFTAGLAIFATVPLNQTYWAQAFVTSLVTSWGMYVSSAFILYLQKLTIAGICLSHQELLSSAIPCTATTKALLLPSSLQRSTTPSLSALGSLGLSSRMSMMAVGIACVATVAPCIWVLGLRV